MYVERDVEFFRRMHEKDESLRHRWASSQVDALLGESLLHRWASSQIDALLLQGALCLPVLEDQIEPIIVARADSKNIVRAQVYSGMG